MMMPEDFSIRVSSSLLTNDVPPRGGDIITLRFDAIAFRMPISFHIYRMLVDARAST